MTSTGTITDYLTRRAAEVNTWLECLVPSEDVEPRQLHKAMRYSLLAGGKRLRPALVLASGEAMGASTDDLMPAACAIEMIHTYSLIHDDLPAMDNDDLRRGRPTCHKAFGEAVAILAGDALLTQAFRVLAADAAHSDPGKKLRVIREIATAAGSVDGMIGGQMADIENEGNDVDAQTLEILDVTSTSEQLGKTPGKDQAANKATYPSVHGIPASERRARELVDEAVQIVSSLGLQTRVLEDIARFIIARTS